MVARNGGVMMKEMGEGGQNVHTSGYKISHKDTVYSIVTTVNNATIHIWM